MNKPTIDDQVAANLRGIALKVIERRFGSDRSTWPADVLAVTRQLEKQQTDFEAAFADHLATADVG